MSFSSTIKDELIRVQNEKSCCNHAILAGLLRTGLMLRDYRGKRTLMFVTEHASVARFLFSRIKDMLSDAPDISGEKTTRLKKHVVYRFNFNKMAGLPEGEKLLQSLGISVDFVNGIKYDPLLLKERCCIRSCLRGGFLAVGSVTNPDKSYHLEMSFMDKTIAAEYMRLMEHFDLKPKHIVRKGYEIVYIKEGQDIVDFLNVIGAHHALMEMENIRILKDMRNHVNRIVNCETANLEKTVNASVKQAEYIRYLEDTVGLQNLPAGLREIARLRLENPEASLSELGKMLTPPLGKSGVNHRLRKLEQIAADHMEKGKMPGIR